MNPKNLIRDGDKHGPGIYMIYCIANEKAYVGRSKNINRRWQQHKWYLRTNKHYNTHLQNAWNKYGESSITFHVLENCENFMDRESYYTNLIGTEYRLNMAAISDKLPISEESRNNMRIAHQKVLTNSYKNKISRTLMGHHVSEETRKKISEALKGRKKPPRNQEYRNNISKSQKGKLMPKLSEETKQKLSVIHKSRGTRPSKLCLEKALEKRKSNQNKEI